MTVREFDGVDDELRWSPGALSSMAFGTVAAIVKPLGGVFNAIFAPHDSSGVMKGQVGFRPSGSVSDQGFYWYTQAGNVAYSAVDLETDRWYLAVVRKPTGNAAARISMFDYSTSTWTHSTTSATNNDWGAAGASGTIRTSNATTEDFPTGRFAVVAAWANSLPWSADSTGDAAIESAGLENSLDAWFTADPDTLWRFDQSTTATSIGDLTGGGADQAGITGTTVVSDDPPGFAFTSPRSPTFVAKYESDWDTGTSPKSVQVTVDVDDVLVVVAAAENGLQTINTPTMTGVTWTLQQSFDPDTSSFPVAAVWSGVATQAGTFALQVTTSPSAGSPHWGFNCLRFNKSSGVGASVQFYGNSGTRPVPFVDITTTEDNSALVAVISDWNAVDGSSRAWLQVNGLDATEQTYAFESGVYTVYAASWADAGPAGSKRVGLSAPSNLNYAILAVEVMPQAEGQPAQGTAAFELRLDLGASGEATPVGSADFELSLNVDANGNAPEVGSSEGAANFDIRLNVGAQGQTTPVGSADFGMQIALEATSPLDVSSGVANFQIRLHVETAGNSPIIPAGAAGTHFSLRIRAVGVNTTKLIPVRVLTPEEILTSNRFTKFHLEILDNGDNPIGVLDGLTGGKLDWIANAMVKGGGSITVKDVGQDVNWLTVRLRPVMTIQGLPPQPLGVFLVTESPATYGKGSRKTWSLKVLDKTTILDQDTVATSFALPAGAVVTDEIIAIIESAGIMNYAVTPSPATLPGALVWEPGTSKLRIVNDLLSAINYFSLYANFQGQVVAEPYTLPAKRPIVYEFLDGKQSIYRPDFRKDEDLWSIPNRVVAVSMGDGVNPAISKSIDNTDPSSPYSIPSRGRVIGYVERGVEIVDEATLDAYVRRRLVELTSPTSIIEIQHAPVPGLTVNQTVRLRRVPVGIDNRHTVSKTSIELRGKALATTSLREVVDL